jgi:hypothetical protein
MQNIVISEKQLMGYYVQYPYGSHLNFVATSFIALKDGLKFNKWNYKPVIYAMDTWHKTPKFRKLTGAQLKSIFEEVNIK